MPLRLLLARLGLAVSSALVTLLVAEVALRQTPLGAFEPLFAGKDEYLPTLSPGARDLDREPLQEGFLYRMPRTQALAMPVRSEFQMPKPAGTFRIFVFGGSVSLGCPITLAAGPTRDLSLGTWLGLRLSRRYPERRIEVLNAGVGGINLEEACRYARECLAYEPDAFLFHSGNNEFLPHSVLAAKVRSRRLLALPAGHPLLDTRLGRLWHAFLVGREERRHPDLGTTDFNISETMLGPSLTDAEDEAQIARSYRRLMKSMADICQRRGVALVLCTLAANLAEFEPNRSSTRSPLAEAQRVEIEAALRSARERAEQGDPATALQWLSTLPPVAEEIAEVHFRRGRCLLELGDLDAAWTALGRARDLDAIQGRTPSALNQIVREVCAGGDAVLCDVERSLRESLGGRAPGYDLFLDNCHPNFEGTRRLVDALEETFVAARLVPGAAVDVPADLRAVSIEHELAPLGYQDILAVQMYGDMGRSFGPQILTRRYDPGRRLEVARGFFQKVFDVRPDHYQSQLLLGCVELMAGEEEQARRRFARYQKDERSLHEFIRKFLDRSHSRVIRKAFEEAGFYPDPDPAHP